MWKLAFLPRGAGAVCLGKTRKVSHLAKVGTRSVEAGVPAARGGRRVPGAPGVGPARQHRLRRKTP